MLVRNLITGSTPAVLHRNGDSPEWQFLWGQVVADFFSEPPRRSEACPELTVLTWTNRSAKTLLEQCLDRWGIQRLTLGRGLPEWRNDMKLFLNVEALDRIDSEYVMALDADDVLMVADLHHILATFRAFGCDLVFNAEKNNYPQAPFLAAFEESIAESAYCHLNSGAWIGKTDRCRRFFRDCLHEDNGDIVAADTTAPVFRDDQGVARKVFQRYHPAVRLDYHCQIFQSLNRVATSGEVLIEHQTDTAATVAADVG